ncbi:hypothetical protein P43SY_009714 [Pythium insidiosum]|uniref:CULT domain-containing protein n=1 Tax=Pythium insidiosum TaxID=114742 RepID=A0AAD5Q7A9_PYTIN|nr:hypothetical protein P43SY_009714 [Pythium insidiosum]
MTCRRTPRWHGATASLLLLLLTLALAPPATAGHERRLTRAATASAVVETATSDEVHIHHHGDDGGGVAVRCRMCGAKIADKADYMELFDTAKAVSSRETDVLGQVRHLHTFVNPSRVEMELVAFRKVVGLEGEAFTTTATFFDGYNWRDLRCSSCNRHIGWKFHHDDLQKCIHDKILDVMSSKSQDERKASTADELAKNKEPSSTPLLSSDVVQFFAGGQHCDENGELRNSKVVYTCCATNPKSLSIENVEEPSLCSYLLTVCVPALCEARAPKTETPYNFQDLARECEREFSATHGSQPGSFAALRWSTIISEDSSELDWARDMRFKA